VIEKIFTHRSLSK